MSQRPVGLILSGGGANGAYEVGLTRALLEGASPSTLYRPLQPTIFTGTSVGAYNAAMLASQPVSQLRETALYLERIWRERIADTSVNCGNGVFRIRADPFQFLDVGCLRNPAQLAQNLLRDATALTAFGAIKGAELLTSNAPLESRLLNLFDLDALVSESPLQRLIHETIDLQGIAATSSQLTVATTDWKHGTLRLWQKQEIANCGAGHEVILGSTALPGIFPPVVIDDVPYVDGGVLMNTPLKPAIQDGAEELHVIFLDPLIENIPLPRLPSSIDTFTRLFAIIWSSRLANDLRRATGITQTLLKLQESSSETWEREEVGDFLEAGHRILNRMQSGREYRPLTIHIYRPATDLGGGAGLLDFSAQRIDSLISLGYQDAVNHDCLASGCVRLPGDPR